MKRCFVCLSIKRKLNRRLILECRCDQRLKTLSTLLAKLYLRGSAEVKKGKEKRKIEEGLKVRGGEEADLVLVAALSAASQLRQLLLHLLDAH